MSIEQYRNQNYKPTEWEDRVIDSEGDIIQEGTPVAEPTMGNIETGILISHLDIGIAATTALQLANLNQLEIEKYKKQRILQGRETISNTISDDGYFRSSDPFKTVALPGFPQINAPHYDVMITPLSSDNEGAIGSLVVYDKTQNGFKVKMTGSATSVSFLWTLVNPGV